MGIGASRLKGFKAKETDKVYIDIANNTLKNPILVFLYSGHSNIKGLRYYKRFKYKIYKNWY